MKFFTLPEINFSGMFQSVSKLLVSALAVSGAMFYAGGGRRPDSVAYGTASALVPTVSYSTLYASYAVLMASMPSLAEATYSREIDLNNLEKDGLIYGVTIEDDLGDPNHKWFGLAGGDGDVDGDGEPEIVVASPACSFTTECLSDISNVYVIYGDMLRRSMHISDLKYRKAGFKLFAQFDPIIPTESLGQRNNGLTRPLPNFLKVKQLNLGGGFFPHSYSSIGSVLPDINADGKADIAIGIADIACDYAQHCATRGNSYVIFGGPRQYKEIDLAHLDRSTGFTVTGSNNVLPTSKGDFNGDRIDDVVLLDWTFLTNRTGAAYIILGHPGVWPATISIQDLPRIVDQSTDEWFTMGALAMGDINGDSIDDFLALTADGGSYVIFGRMQWPTVTYVNQLDGTNGFKIDVGDTRLEDREREAASLGDINGDHIPDFSIATALNPSQIRVIFGRSGNDWTAIFKPKLDGNDGFTFYGNFCRDLHNAGDLNGDEFDDIVCRIDGEADGYGSAIVIPGRERWPAAFNLSQSDGLWRISGSHTNGDIQINRAMKTGPNLILKSSDDVMYVIFSQPLQASSSKLTTIVASCAAAAGAMAVALGAFGIYRKCKNRGGAATPANVEAQRSVNSGNLPPPGYTETQLLLSAPLGSPPSYSSIPTP